jgi:hypothetical protein
MNTEKTLMQFNSEWQETINNKINEYNKILEESKNIYWDQLRIYLYVRFRDCISCGSNNNGYRNMLYRLFYLPVIKMFNIDENIFNSLRDKHEQLRNTAEHDTVLTTEIDNLIEDLIKANTKDEEMTIKYIAAQKFVNTYLSPIFKAVEDLNSEEQYREKSFIVRQIKPFNNKFGKDPRIPDYLYIISNEIGQPENTGMYVGFYANDDGTYTFCTYPIGIATINNLIKEKNIDEKFFTSENSYYTLNDVDKLTKELVTRLNQLYCIKEELMCR